MPLLSSCARAVFQTPAVDATTEIAPGRCAVSATVLRSGALAKRQSPPRKRPGRPFRCSFSYLYEHSGLIDVSLSLLSLPPVARGGIRRVLDAYT